MNIARLIEQPLGPIAIAVLGFVPYSWTKRMIRGQEVERKINALFWNYCRKSGGKQPSVELNVPLLTLMRDTILSTARNCSKNFGNEDKDGG